jgi:hypothetical protein
VLRFTCRFGSWKHHTRQLDPPVGLPPSTRGWSTEFNGQRRLRPISTIYDFYFQLAKLAAHRPGPRAAPPSHTPRRWAELMPPFADPRAALPNKAIIINDLLSAAPRFSMLRNLFRLLVPPSAHTIYGHRTRAGVINYWHQGANVLPVPLPTTPSEITRKIRPEQPDHAILPCRPR